MTVAFPCGGRGSVRAVREIAYSLAELDERLAGLMAAEARQLGPRQLAATEAQMWMRAAAPRRLSIAGAAERMRHQIEAGYLLPGDALPVAAELAARYQLSVSSVNRATALLRREGLLELRREGNGRGVRLYVPESVPGLAQTG
jgi:DNA-binding transcriptional ArsR family regulator